MNSPDGPLESVMIRARPAIVSKGLSNSSSLTSQHSPRAPAKSSCRRQAGTRPHVVPAEVPGFEITREFAGLAKYVALACEAGQGAVCG